MRYLRIEKKDKDGKMLSLSSDGDYMEIPIDDGYLDYAKDILVYFIDDSYDDETIDTSLIFTIFDSNMTLEEYQQKWNEEGGE